MAGIYIHIPFCKQACTYCDFHFSTNQQLRKPLVDAICKEIELRKNEINEPITSLYFGGGSPSILDVNELEQIVSSLHNGFDLSQLQEFTLESNPDDHDANKLEAWKDLGVDRLSIGIQSFIDRDLDLINRAHTSIEAQACVERARTAGFEKITIDLIFGIPGQSFDEWKSNVQMAIDLNTDHISSYALTVEPKTALAHQVAKGIIEEKNDAEVEAEFLYLHKKLAEAGFDHYEISNYAKPGSTAVHNSNYWNGVPYLGFGPSAHSFDGNKVRRWNVSNNPGYIKAIENGSKFYESELLTESERINEQIMTGLRTKKGISKNLVSEVPAEIAEMLIISETRIQIKPENWLLSDAIIRELIH